jgi:hypothetical protein
MEPLAVGRRPAGRVRRSHRPHRRPVRRSSGSTSAVKPLLLSPGCCGGVLARTQATPGRRVTIDEIGAAATSRSRGDKSLKNGRCVKFGPQSRGAPKWWVRASGWGRPSVPLHFPTVDAVTVRLSTSVTTRPSFHGVLPADADAALEESNPRTSSQIASTISFTPMGCSKQPGPSTCSRSRGRGPAARRERPTPSPPVPSPTTTEGPIAIDRTRSSTSTRPPRRPGPRSGRPGPAWTAGARRRSERTKGPRILPQRLRPNSAAGVRRWPTTDRGRPRGAGSRRTRSPAPHRVFSPPNRATRRSPRWRKLRRPGRTLP